jgi:hypothetical protein
MQQEVGDTAGGGGSGGGVANLSCQPETERRIWGFTWLCIAVDSTLV